MIRIYALLAALILLGSGVLTGCREKKDPIPDGSSSSGSISSTPTESVPEKEFSLTEEIDRIYQEVMDGAEDWLAPMDETVMQTGFDMDFSAFESWYGRIPKANVHATSVIGVKAKSGKKEEARAELLKYQQAMVRNFERYLPDQYDLVKNYRLVEKGDYLVLVIADQADEIEKAVEEAFRVIQ